MYVHVHVHVHVHVVSCDRPCDQRNGRPCVPLIYEFLQLVVMLYSKHEAESIMHQEKEMHAMYSCTAVSVTCIALPYTAVPTAVVPSMSSR